MAKFIGRRVDLGVGRETTRGTPVSAAHWVPKVDFSFDDKVEMARANSSLGIREDVYQSHVLTKWGEGDLGAEVRSESFGLFLYALMGTCSTAGPTDSAYTHTFTVENTNTCDSLTFVVIDPNTEERYSMVMLNSLELTQELDDLLRFNANFMGRTSKGTDDTASYAAEYKFTKKHFSLKIGDDISDLAAASAISVKSFGLTFENNVTPDNVLGTAEPEDFLNQTLSVEGTFTLNYEGETYKNYMRNNSQKAMEVAWTNTDQTIGASTNPSLTIQLAEVDFFDWEPNYALDEIVTQSISFKAHYDLDTESSMIDSIALVNTTTSY